MAPKAKAKAGAAARQRSTSASAKAKAKAGPKAKAEPKARASSSTPNRDTQVERAETLLKECLVEQDIAHVDGRVLDIAVGQAKLLEGVDAALLSRAEARLAEFRAFEVELQKRAEELRALKAEVIERQDAVNDEFSDSISERQRLKKKVEELFDAVGDGDLDKVRSFVRSHCTPEDPGSEQAFPPALLSLDVEDHDGNTPLSEAACYGEVEIVEFLLERGAHPNSRNRQGRTPLWRATYNGHEDIVKFLLEKGADPLIENNDGEPPGKFGTPGTKQLIAGWDRTLTAERQEDLKPLQRLPYPWPNLLLKACQTGDVAAASDVLKAISDDAGETGKARALLRTVLDFEDMVDPLWMACTKGHLDLSRALIDAGAAVDTSSDGGLTCLMIACRKGHAAIAKELMQRGAKTFLRSGQGRLASDYARETGDGHGLHDVLIEHCRKIQDWSTLEEEARQHTGNKACGVEAAERLIETRRNVAASSSATAALRALPAEEIRQGSDRYRDLLEQRALADVLGMG